MDLVIVRYDRHGVAWSPDRVLLPTDRPRLARSSFCWGNYQNFDAAAHCYIDPVTGRNRSGAGYTHRVGGGAAHMTVPDERFPRPRALRDHLSRRPQLVEPPPPIPEPRPAVDDSALEGPAWFSYIAAGDEIVWSAGLAAMLGRPPSGNEIGRQVVTRYVHRDDHAKALGAITRTWTGRQPVRVTVRLMRADGSWFDVDCRLEPIAGPEGTVRGVQGTVHDVSVRERARREVARLTRRSETVQASIIERDPATRLLTRARFADEVDRALKRRSGGAVLVVRIEADRADAHGDGVRPG